MQQEGAIVRNKRTGEMGRVVGGRVVPLNNQPTAPIDTGVDPRIEIARSAEKRAQLKFQQETQDRTVEAEERAAQEQQQASAIDDAKYQIRNVIKAAKAAKEKSNEWFATGFGAETARSLGGSSAADVAALLNTIGANTAFDRLQKMREQSKTGGALGQVSEIELQLLRDSVASISQNQSDAQFQENMEKIVQAYSRVLNKLDGETPGKPTASPEDEALIKKYLD